MMKRKKIFIALLLNLLPMLTFSQQSKLYLGFNLGYGIRDAYSISLYGDLPLKDWNIGLDFNYLTGDAKNVPLDYEPGLVLWGDGTPISEMYSIGPTLSKNIKINSKTIFYPKAGITLNIVQKPENFRPDNCSGMFCLGGNYDYDYIKSITAGLLLNPSIQFITKRKAAFTIGIRSNINPKYTTLSGEAGFVFGIGGGRRLF